MDAGRVLRLEARLRRRSLELREEIARSLHPAGSPEAGLADRRDAAHDDALAALARELDAASVERDGDELRAVEEALRRVVTGTYGTCVACGEPIEPARLDAIPHAPRCTACAERGEREHGATVSRM